MFLCMPLGRMWQRQTKTPFVLDLQDPWASDYEPRGGAASRKYDLARRVHARLEPWTMKHASGIVAVSPAYIETIRRRYPWIAEETCATIPFGVALEDFAAAARVQPAIRREPLRLTGVYVGAGGPAMATSLRILFAAVAKLRAIDSALAEKLRLAFIGTDYAPGGQGRKTVEPIAAEAGVGAQVTEQTDRVAYFVALQTLRAADFVLLIGSDDAQYTAVEGGAVPGIEAADRRDSARRQPRRSSAGTIETHDARDLPRAPPTSIARRKHSRTPLGTWPRWRHASSTMTWPCSSLTRRALSPHGSVRSSIA